MLQLHCPPPVSLSSDARASASPATTNFPSKAELLACLPPELLQFKPAKAWGSLIMSLSLSLVAYGLGTQIPLTPTAAPSGCCMPWSRAPWRAVAG